MNRMCLLNPKIVKGNKQRPSVAGCAGDAWLTICGPVPKLGTNAARQLR